MLFTFVSSPLLKYICKKSWYDTFYENADEVMSRGAHSVVGDVTGVRVCEHISCNVSYMNKDVGVGHNPAKLRLHLLKNKMKDIIYEDTDRELMWKHDTMALVQHIKCDLCGDFTYRSDRRMFGYKLSVVCQSCGNYICTVKDETLRVDEFRNSLSVNTVSCVYFSMQHELGLSGI